VTASPALELTGFGIVPPPGPPDEIDSVTATVNAWTSVGGMPPLTYELRDAAGTLIGTRTGQASTSTSHYDTVVFASPAPSWDQLAGLQLWIYADSGSAAPGSVVSVDYASLSVAYVPSGIPYAVPQPSLAAAPGTAAQPAAGVTALSGIAIGGGTIPGPGAAVTALAGPAAAAGTALPVANVANAATGHAGPATATGTIPAPGTAVTAQAGPA